MAERLNDSAVTTSVDAVVVNTTEGSLRLDASIEVPTYFVGLVGIPSINAKLVSQATRKQLDLEVAMVLDNSGSMGSYSRMTNLKKAARCAVNILFNGITDCSDAGLTAADPLSPTVSNVKIGIAPFTEFVNVGTGYKTATWMDQAGISDVAQDSFDDDDYDGTSFSSAVNRFDLYNAIGIDWEGCVEARNHTTGTGGLYYDTSDLTPDVLVPDSLFVPAFAPDQADSGYSNSYIDDAPSACTNLAPQYIWTQTKYGCDNRASSQSRYDSAVCGGDPTLDEYSQVSEAGIVSVATSTRPLSLFNNPDPGASGYSDSYATIGGSRGNRTIQRVRTWTYQFSDQELQERLCKYAAGTSVSSLSGGPGGRTGPNADCPGAALMPLSETKSSILTRLTDMNAGGGTNIHQGVMWGFHMLSPTEPLTEAKVYDGVTSKVMIVMTDGENTHSYRSDFAGADWYTAYGYPYSGRLTGSSDTDLQAEMDDRTEATCANAKAENIAIYTVGLSPPNQTTTDMLTNCASVPSMAYFPASATELVDVFQEIASQLADLRLAL